MRPERLTAFTDGVVAIIITIMVLELHVPHGSDLHALLATVPILAAYALSYINVGLYWANHHHMLAVTERVDGRVLWANLLLLFGLSLVPFVIRWVDEAGFTPAPVAAYGVVLGAAALCYQWLQRAIIRANGGEDSPVARAVGRDRKGRLSLVGYGVAVAAATIAPVLACLVYVAIALAWLVPDRRYEQAT
jgi:uncharacterized membrane protein